MLRQPAISAPQQKAFEAKGVDNTDSQLWAISAYRAPRWSETPDGDTFAFPEEKPLGLAEVWKILRKHRWLILFVLLVVGGLGVVWTFSKIPMYTAKATLKIEPQTLAILRVEDRVAQTTADPAVYDYYKTQFALLQNRPLAARVIKELQLDSNPTFLGTSTLGVTEQLRSRFSTVWQSLSALVSHLSQVGRSSSSSSSVENGARQPSFAFDVHPGIIRRYLSLLDVKPVSGTRLVEVAFTTPDPALSQRLANAHIAAFIRQALESRFELTEEAREFLQKKLTELRKDVEHAGTALNQFREERGVVSLEGNENIGVERMVELNRRLTDARAKRIELESLYQMTAQNNSHYLPLVVEDGLVRQLKTNLATLEAESARLSSTFTAAHPRLRELHTQIDEIRRRLDQEITDVLRRIAVDAATARHREATLQREVEEQQQRVLRLKAIEADYNFLKEEATSSRALYEAVLKRLHETSLWNESVVSNIEISEPAELPLAPSSPQRQRDFTLSVIAGLFLAVGLAVFLEYSDSTVKTPEDIWQAGAVYTLGLVPQQTRTFPATSLYGHFARFLPTHHDREPLVTLVSSSSPALFVSTQQPFGLVEFYRNICASLLLSRAGNPPQTILVTSAHAGDGKTVTTVNLGISLAQLGYSVVVVDADLRQGGCHTLLGQRNVCGLTDVLHGLLPVRTVLQETTVPGLSFLCRGEAVPNPTRLLGSQELKALMGDLRQRFDFIVLDSPPAIALSDAALLSQVCDGALLVTRWGKTPAQVVRRLVDRLDAIYAPVLGVILNGVDLRDPDYVDYRQYYRATENARQRVSEET
ncbi:MAG: GumC family protein [Candidatus Binatia bacterium]